MTGDVRDFVLSVPEASLDDLRTRLRRTRLPEAATITRPGGPSDWSKGPPRAYVAELIRYWTEHYNWRRVETELNHHGHSHYRIDDLDLHFLHVRSERPDARPLILTHGWPGSIVDALEVVDALAHPPASHLPAFHVVAPSLPGFGFSSRPRSRGWSVEHTADAWAELMARLGYDRYFAAGGDWGGHVTTALADQHGDRVAAIHTHAPFVRPPAGPAAAYGLVDSPVALLTAVLESLRAGTDGGGPAGSVSRDRILDTVMMYWLPGSGASAMRFCADNRPADQWGLISTPAAVSDFPGDRARTPRARVEARFPHLMSWHEAERGGHFPMLEAPADFVAEIRTGLAAMPWRAWGGNRPRRAAVGKPEPDRGRSEPGLDAVWPEPAPGHNGHAAAFDLQLVELA